MSRPRPTTSSKTLDRLSYPKGSDFADIIARDGYRWLVYDPSPAGHWSPVESGDVVRVPLIPHLTANGDPSSALAYAALTGFLLNDLAFVSHVHAVVGSPVESLNDEAGGVRQFRFWFGLAVRIS